MCGIAGFVAPPGQYSEEELRAHAEVACASLAHRGPDDQGTWIDVEAGVALAHRRLAVLDTSAVGHQPMISPDGRYVMVYNGEVYNFRELRGELEQTGVRFQGHCDTGVLLAAIGRWGIEPALRRCNGMFAFALWDRSRRTLWLARDRLGQKPLYYGQVGNCFAFASELKAMHHHPRFSRDIDRGALTLFLRCGNVPAPYSIYQGIGKLPPGCFHSISFDGANDSYGPQPYWSAIEAARRGIADPLDGLADDAVAELDVLLREAVRLCMVSDVPLGAFLSGGIDSSTVVALMQAQSTQAVRTFSIGFREQGYNEADHAAQVAAHLGTDHTELYVTAADAQAVIPKLPALYDEPFADTSQIPTVLVSQLARKTVTVSLSGDGGDEMFGGYDRHIWAGALRRVMATLPLPVRRRLAVALRDRTAHYCEAAFEWVSPVLPRKLRYHQAGDKLQRLGQVLDAVSRDDLYRRLTSPWQIPNTVGHEAVKAESWAHDQLASQSIGGFVNHMILLDTLGYLPDDILVKLDRATMSVSLEGRVPFLDHRILEFSWRIPLSMKIRNGRGKWLLRRLLAKYLPEGLIERPKMGFGVPVENWLRSELRDWAEDLLDPNRLEEAAFLESEPVRTLWREHLSGHRNWQRQIWPVLMFEAWRRSHQ